MVNLIGIVSTLRATRQELLQQLDAVEKAIAALERAPAVTAESASTEDAPPAEAMPNADRLVVPTILKPKRVLDESHKQAMIRGRRKARNAKEAAKGLAREMPDESFVPALSSRGERQPPRLVKKRGGP